jgi:hypothetical protein
MFSHFISGTRNYKNGRARERISYLQEMNITNKFFEKCVLVCVCARACVCVCVCVCVCDARERVRTCVLKYLKLYAH